MESGKKRHSRFKLQFLLFVHSPLIGVLKKKLKKQKQKNKKQIFVNDKDTKKKKKLKPLVRKLIMQPPLSGLYWLQGQSTGGRGGKGEEENQ